jgi:uncharacterized protein (TIGR02217 family)
MPTVLSDVILSNGVIHAGVRGKQMRRNERVATDNGAENVNIVWTQTLREYELATVPLRREHWMELEGLHEVTEGGGYGFLLLDPKDHRVTSGGVANSLTSTTFQLYRHVLEPVSGRTKARKLTRLHAASFQLFLSGVLQPSGYSLDAQTGIVTIGAAPAEGTIGWTGVFYVPVHFMADNLDWDMVVSGPDPDGRFMVGPSVVLREIRE